MLNQWPACLITTFQLDSFQLQSSSCVCIPFAPVGFSPFVTNLIAVTALVAAGCTREGLSSVYLLSLSYNLNVNITTSNESNAAGGNANISSLFASLVNNGTSLEIRAGYFGICLLDRSVNSSRGWICANLDTLSSLVQDDSLQSHNSDPLNIVNAIQHFKDDVAFVPFL